MVEEIKPSESEWFGGPSIETKINNRGNIKIENIKQDDSSEIILSFSNAEIKKLELISNLLNIKVEEYIKSEILKISRFFLDECRIIVLGKK